MEEQMLILQSKQSYVNLESGSVQTKHKIRHGEWSSEHGPGHTGNSCWARPGPTPRCSDHISLVSLLQPLLGTLDRPIRTPADCLVTVPCGPMNYSRCLLLGSACLSALTQKSARARLCDHWLISSSGEGTAPAPQV